MRITDADREFGHSIPDVTENLVDELSDPLLWVADMAAAKGPPEKVKELIGQLRTVLARVLQGDQQPDEAMRRRCAEIYLRWLAAL